MDTNELANQIVAALAPNVNHPDVMKLRGAIEPKMKGNIVTESAWNDFAKTPSDDDSAASFRKELKKMIVADADFALQLVTLVSQIKVTNVSAGRGGVAVGGDVQGSIVIGSNNMISHQSGGINITDSDVKVDGDLVGRDKKG